MHRIGGQNQGKTGKGARTLLPAGGRTSEIILNFPTDAEESGQTTAGEKDINPDGWS